MFLWKTIFLVTIFFLSLSSSLFVSCLMFILSSMIVSISFLNMNYNWLMYTMMILYLGGMMVLFMYMCSIASISKIETNSVSAYLSICSMSVIFYWALPKLEAFSNEMNVSSMGAVYLLSSQWILSILGVYLIIGLLTSVFFIEKIKGPLKSFYVK